MTKERYLGYRNEGAPDPLYYFYLEHRNKDKDLLGIEDFFMYIQQWPFAQDAFNTVMTTYDVKFNVLKVTDLRTGNIIKYL